ILFRREGVFLRALFFFAIGAPPLQVRSPLNTSFRTLLQTRARGYPIVGAPSRHIATAIAHGGVAPRGFEPAATSTWPIAGATPRTLPGTGRFSTLLAGRRAASRQPDGENRMNKLSAVLALLGSLSNIGPATSQTYPSRPITMVVPFAAGGPMDV